MASTKTDFAQKLLHDLRLRKERMAAAESQQQYSSNGSSSTSTRGSSPGPAYKGYQLTNTYEHVGLKSENSFSKPNGRSKSFQYEDTSNHQIVPYMNEERSSAVMELGFHKKTDPKGRNPMLSFLQEIGKRSLGKGRIEIRSSFGKNSSSADSHVITFSQVHIGEISKGIQKLNQVLKNCSKGISLERYSSDVGKELLKGAIDLEQSLRMLANEGSSRGGGGKNKIKLLEDDNKDNENARSNDLNQVERPRFSFDKPNKNVRKTKNIVKQLPEETSLHEKQRMSKAVIHSRSFSMDLDAENELISSGLQQKNPRTSNVIAKLMGLEDLPRKDDSIKSRELQPQHKKRTISPSSKSNDAMRSKTTNTDSMFAFKADKIMSPNRGSSNQDSIFAIKADKIMSPNRGSSTRLFTENDTSAGSVTRIRAVTVDKEEEVKNIQIDEHHGNKIVHQETRIEDNDDEVKEKNVIMHDKALSELGAFESKHEKHSVFHNLQQQKKVRKLNVLEEKRKLPHSKPKPLTRESKGSPQACKTSLRDTDKRQASKTSDTKTVVKPLQANRPKIMFNERQGLDRSSTKGETDEMKISKHQMEAAVDENTTVLKPEAHSIVLEPIEHENAKKTIVSGLAKQESSPLTTEAVSSQLRKPETSLQTSKSTELSRKVAEEINYYNHSKEKDQSPVYSKPPTANANIIDIAEEAIEVTNDFQSSPQPSLCADDTEMEPLKTSLPQHKGNHEAVSIHVAENKNTIRSTSWYTDELTEPENELKGILIKNRLFLHTAESLFKLNIPVIMLHDVDQSYNLPDNKLILDCGIELLMKKAKRRQFPYYPFKSEDCAIMFQSFDGLIRQLNTNLCTLESYGGEWDEEYDPSENIYQMLEKDVEYRDPDINSMWDFGWNENTVASSEKDEVIKEVEKHILRKLLDELTRDLLDTQTNAISIALPKFIKECKCII